MARGLKIRIKAVEGLYCLCSENKVADQLHGYRTADLRLCFRMRKNPVFSRHGTYKSRGYPFELPLVDTLSEAVLMDTHILLWRNFKNYPKMTHIFFSTNSRYCYILVANLGLLMYGDVPVLWSIHHDNKTKILLPSPENMHCQYLQL